MAQGKRGRAGFGRMFSPRQRSASAVASQEAQQKRRERRVKKWRERFRRFGLSAFQSSRIVQGVCDFFRSGAEAARAVRRATGAQVVGAGYGRQLRVEGLEERHLLATMVWDGGGEDNNWSTAANWVGDAIPAANDDLVFPVAAIQKSNVNDFASGTAFGSVLFAGSDYNLSGNLIQLNGSVTSEASNNDFGLPVTLGSSGGFSHIGGGTFTVSSTIDTVNNGLSLNSSGTLLLSGSISGDGSVTTGGSGTVALSGSNSYSGLTTVAGGTLAVRHDQALGSAASGTVVTGTNARIRLENGVTVSDESLSSPLNVSLYLESSGAGDTNVWTGDVTSGSYFYLYPASNSTLELSGAVSTTLSRDIYKQNPGRAILSGSLSNVSRFYVSSGVLDINEDLSTSAYPIVTSGGTLGGTGSLSWTSGAGEIQGTLNPGTGSTTGIFSIEDITMQSSGGLSVQLNGLTAGTEHDQLQVTGTVNVAGNLTVTLDPSFTPEVGDSFIILDKVDAGSVGGTFNGLGEGGLLTVNGLVFRISYAGGNDGNNDVVLTRVAAGIWDGGGGDNNWSTAANWAGDVAPVAGANLIFPSGAPQANSFNDFAPGTNFNSILIGGSNYNLSGNAIVLSGSVTSQGSNNTFNVPVTLGSSGGFSHIGGGTFTVSSTIDTVNNGLSLNSSGTLLLSGSISGDGSVTTGGSGTVALSGSNSYSGLTTVAGGTLAVRHDQALGSTASGTVVTGTNARIRLENGVTVSDESLSSSLNVYFNLESSGAGTTNVWTGDVTSGSYFSLNPASNSTLELSGTVSTPNHYIYKQDSGRAILSGSLSNVSRFYVYSGVLDINEDLSTSAYPIVYSGGTLGGTGSLSWTSGAGDIQGTLNPGTGSTTGIFSIEDITMQSSGGLSVQLNGLTAGTEHDQLQVTGTVNVAGNLTVTLDPSFTPEVGDSFIILDKVDAGSVNGTFNGLAQHGLITFGGNIFQINYFGGDGNDIELTATSINNAPIANAQTLSTNEETALNITLTGVDLEGHPITFSIDTPPSHGTLTGSDANRVYTPALNYAGSDSFVFVVTDSLGRSNTATITIDVVGINDVPVATGNTVTTNEDTSYTFSSSDFTYTDIEDDSLSSITISNISLAGGSLRLDGIDVNSGDTISAIDIPNLVYTPVPNQYGMGIASFKYQVNDAGVGSVAATLAIDVSSVNDSPVAADDAIALNENGTVTTLSDGTTTSLLANDTDADLPNDSLTLTTTPVVAPQYGSLTLNANGTFSYTHDGSENFTDSFIYEVKDAAGASHTATVSITITPVNDNAPTADGESFTVAEGGVATEANLDDGVSLLDGDSDIDLPNDALEVDTTPVSGPAHGSLTLNANGTFSYTHDGSENFTDSFTYRVFDQAGQSTTATVSITITPVNDNAPTADGESFTVAEGGVATEANLDDGVSLLDGDSDIDLPNDALEVDTTPVSGPAHGSLTLNANGTFSYTHDGSENFTDSFTYRVFDQAGQSTTATVSITITPVNDNAPTADGESFTVAEGGVATEANLDDGVSLLDGDSDIDLPNDALEVDTTPVSGPAHGSLTLNANGTFSYTHDGSENFTDSFTYRVFDQAGQSTTATVSITITPVNDNAPAFVTGNTASANEEDGDFLVALEATDDDAPAQTVTFSIDSASPGVGADGALFEIVNGNELRFLSPPSFELPADANSDNVYEVTVIADDGNGLTTSLTIEVTVEDVSEEMVVAASGDIRLERDGVYVQLVDVSSGTLVPGSRHLFTNVTSTVIHGDDATDDTLIVDFSNGNPVAPGGVTFHGGAGGNDGIEIQAASLNFSKIEWDYNNPNDGAIVLDHADSSSDATIHYTGLEPVLVNVGTVADAEFNLPIGSDAVLEDVGGGDLRLRSPSGDFEATTFPAPTSSLTINGDASLEITTAVTVSSAIALNVSHVTLHADLTAPSLTGTATTVTVDDVPLGDPAQIQDGIEIAASGAVVSVMAGLYNESITISKTLDLVGVDPALVTINSGPLPTPIVVSGASTDVLISGFTITGGIFGLDVDGAQVTLSNSVLNGGSAIGVLVDNGGGVTIEDSTLDGAGSGSGVAIVNGTGSILRSIIKDRTDGVVVGAAGTAVVLHGNDLANSFSGTGKAIQANPAAGIINASGNWWGSNDESYIAGIVLGSIDFSPYLESGSDLDTSDVGFDGDFSHLHVTARGEQFGGNGRIREAVGLIADGGETGADRLIEVHDNTGFGNYVENSQIFIGVGDDVTITGVGASKPVITPGQNFTGGSAASAWILVDAGTTFNLNNVVLDGDGSLVWQALRSHGTTTVDGVDFRDIRGQVDGGPYQGVAVQSYGGTVGGGAGADSHGSGGASSHLVVKNSTFEDIGRIGVLVKGDGATADVNNIQYTGKGLGDWIDYGVEAGAGAEVNIVDATISNNLGTALSDGSTSAGVLVSTYWGAGTKANLSGNNSISGNTDGVYAGYAASDGSTVIVNGGVFSNNESTGIRILGASASLEIHGAEFTGNEFGVSATLGADLSIDGSSTLSGNTTGIFVGDNATATIEGNALYNNTTAVHFASGGIGNVTNNNFEGGGNPDNDTDVLYAVDAGAVAAPLTGNTFAGTVFIDNQSPHDITALRSPVGDNEYNIAGSATTNDFDIEDRIFHEIDDSASGLVTWIEDTIFVTPVEAGTESASNNDYLRIKNAIEAAANGSTIVLGKNSLGDGVFNWDETFALASWELGNDGIASTDDDWGVLLGDNQNNVTVTAIETDEITIQGPGDIDSANLEGVFVAFDNGTNTGWTFENFNIFDVDNAFGFYYVNDDFSGLTINKMHIRVAADAATGSGGDVNQNIGIHYARGTNIKITDNIIDIVGTGDGTTMAIQSNTHGGANYHGLEITGNTITVLNPNANGERIYGIWENGHAHASTITIAGNKFYGSGADPSTNNQTAFRITSHSSATTTVTYLANEVHNAQEGFKWLDVYASNPQDYTGTLPIKLTNNMLFNVGTGIDVGGINASALLSNNTLTNSGVMEHVGIGLKLQAGNSATVDGSPSDNKFIGFNTAIQSAGTLIVEDNGNSIHGNLTGIAVTGGTATITNNYIYNNTTGIDVTGGSADILGNFIYQNAIGARFATTGSGEVTGNEFNDATFDNDTDLRLESDAGLVDIGALNLFAGDTYFIDNRSTQSFDLTGANSQNYQGDLAVLNPGTFDHDYRIEDKMHHRVDTSLALTVGLIAWSAGNLFVTKPGGGSTDSNVQRGIDAVPLAPGWTVNVEDGTYVEQVLISKDLTLLGQSEAGTILQAPAVLDTSIGFSGRQSVITIDGGSVNVGNLTIDGYGSAATASSDFHGIGIHNADVVIDGVTVERVRTGGPAGTFNGAQRGRAIFALNDSGTHTVEVKNSTISDYQKNGIDMRGAGLTAIITSNEIYGAGPTDVIAQNGIVIFGGAIGDISGNKIEGHVYTDIDTSSAGILLYGAGVGTVVSNNLNINDNQLGVAVDSNTFGATISGNTITGSTSAGIRVNGGSAWIQGNTIRATDGNAVGIRVFGGAIVDAGSDNGIDGDPTGLGNSTGGNILTGYTGAAGSFAIENLNDAAESDVYARFNDFGPFVNESIIEDYVYDDTDDSALSMVIFTGALNAQPAPLVVYVDDNWANTALGDDADGAGNTVTNWGLPGDLANGTEFGVDQFATIQDALNAIADGGTIYVYAGTYAEAITVTKDISLVGAQTTVDADARFAAFTSGSNGPKASDSIESVITAPVNNPTGGNPGANDLVRVLTNGVTITGFVIDGNNPDLGASSTTVGGVDVHARRAITNVNGLDVVVPINDLLVEENILQNFGQRAISLANETGVGSTGNVITENVVRGAKDQAIILFTNAYADITNNTVEVPSDAIGLHLQNFYANGTMDWSGNNITVGQDGIGIHANMLYAADGELNIADNTVNAAAGVTGDSDFTWGINVWTIQVGSTVSLTNNIVGNAGGEFARGINLWNLPTTDTVTVSGGSVGNSVVGINLDSIDPYFGAGANTTVDISNVVISGGDIGIRVRAASLTPPPLSGSNVVSGTVTANISGGEISGAGIGIDALNGTVKVNGTNIHDNGTGIRLEDVDAELINIDVHDNDGTGIWVEGTSSLVMTGGVVSNNAYNGLYVNGDGTLQTVDVDGTDFIGNANGQANLGDIVLFNFSGPIGTPSTASFKNVDVTSNNSDYGIQVRGTAGTLPFLDNTTTAEVSFENVNILGTQTDQAMLIQQYADLNQFTFTDVVFDSIAAGGLVIYDAAGTLDLGNTTFHDNYWLGDGSGDGTGYDIATSLTNIDATDVIFLDSSDVALDKNDLQHNFAIEDRVAHIIDADAPGPLVTGLIDWVGSGVYANSVFVTQESFIPPVLSTSPSIQRGIDAAPVGGDVWVEGGSYTYTENLSIIGKDVNLRGETGNAPNLQPAAGGNLITIDGSSFGGDGNVVIDNFNFNGLAGLASVGINVPATASFTKLTVNDTTFTGFGNNAIYVGGNGSTGISVQNVEVANSMFTDNGIAGGGGSGDLQFFEYNGNATLTNLDLTNSGAGGGAHSGIQFRGVGAQDGTGVLVMGTIALTDVDISGKYVRQMIGLQRYDTATISFNDVRLGGVGSEITGTFGAALRIDAVGDGTFGSSTTIDLNDTYFRGVGGLGLDIEIAPDGFGFLRADATFTRWDTTLNTEVTPDDPSVTLDELFEIEDRILHYVDGLHSMHGEHDGFVEIVDGNAYITTTQDGNIQRGINVVDGGDTVHVNTGSYDQSFDVNKGVKIQGVGQGSTTITGSVVLNAADGADRMELHDLSVIASDSAVVGASRYAIRVDASAGNTAPVTIENVTARSPLVNGVYGAGLLITLDTNVVDDVVITNSTFDDSYTHGLYVLDTVGTTGQLTNLEISGSSFSDNDAKGEMVPGLHGFGMVFQNGTSAPQTVMVDGVNITNTTISGNHLKGIYAESMSNALFDTVIITNNGTTATSGGPTGLELNLKYEDFTNINIVNATISNNGTDVPNSAGLAIKARGSGIDSGSYTPNPATLTGVLISGGTFSGNQVGILIGEPGQGNTSPTGVTIEDVTVENSALVGIEVVGGEVTINNSELVDNPTGIRVAGAGRAVIANNPDGISGGNIGLDVDGGRALVEDTVFATTQIGVLVQNDGLADLGQAAGSEVDYTGLGESTGGNDFTAYAAAASATNGAIVNLNTGGDYTAVGPQGYVGPAYDVAAFNNQWAVGTPAGIENVIWHDADDDALGFVDFASLSNVVVTFDSTTIVEGNDAELTITFENDAQDHTLTIDWGDGTTPQVETIPAGTFTATFLHTYVDDDPTNTASDPVTVSWTLEDSSGAIASDIESLTINNDAPVLVLDPVMTIDENGFATLSGTISDSGAADTFKLVVNWGDGGAPQEYIYAAGTTTFSETHQYLDDDPSGTPSDPYTISATVTDDDTGVGSDTTSVTVNNVAPEITSLNITSPITEFTTATLSGTFTDDSPLDTFTLLVDWGDGSGIETFTYAAGTTSFSETHTYNIDGNFTVTVTLEDDDTGSDTSSTNITVNNDSLKVIAFQQNPSGFDITFNRALSLAQLNLYDGIDAAVEAPDLTLVGSSVGNVRGSMVWNAATNTLSFVKTGGPLVADAYTLTLKSGSDAFKDTFGNKLDGDGDNNDLEPSDDYVDVIVVAPAAARVVTVRDLARGPGQDVDDAPEVANSRLAIRVGDSSNLRSMDFWFTYDTTLFDITGVTLADAPTTAGWTIFVDSSTPGVLKVSTFGVNALPVGSDTPIVLLDVTIPDDALYGASQVMRITNTAINVQVGMLSVSVPSIGDHGIHKNVYLGDADVNLPVDANVYDGFDAALIQRVATGADSGFDDHDWTDPTIVVDADRDGMVDGGDASIVAQYIVGNPTPQIPGPVLSPADLIHVLTGDDPLLSIGDIPVTAGLVHVIPVTITIDPSTTVYSATFDVEYDDSVMDFAGAVRGADFPAGSWLFTSNETPSGTVKVTVFSASGITTGPSAETFEIAKLTFNIPWNAPAGESPLDIIKANPNEGGLVWSVDSGLVDIAPSVGGDYNVDGHVDAADYVLWRKMETATVPNYIVPDGSGNGLIDDDDYDLWYENFGETVSSGSGGVALQNSASAGVNVSDAAYVAMSSVLPLVVSTEVAVLPAPIAPVEKSAASARQVARDTVLASFADDSDSRVASTRLARNGSPVLGGVSDYSDTLLFDLAIAAQDDREIDGRLTDEESDGVEAVDELFSEFDDEESLLVM